MVTSAHESGIVAAIGEHVAAENTIARFEMRPPAIGSAPPATLLAAPRVDHRDAETWRPVGLDQIRPPADDRLALVRNDIVEATRGRGSVRGRCSYATEVLAQRAELGDVVAWEAVRRDLRSSGNGLDDAADALGAGKLDAAVHVCASVCGMSNAEWFAESRAELAKKGGAR